MRGLAALLVCFGLAACGEPAPKSGVMPGIAGGPYEAPKNAEAAAAYMAGFHARYDIPELDYPQDIKDRIRAARNKRFIRDMEVAEKRQKIMSKLALTVLAQKDHEAKEVLKKLKENPKAKPGPSDINQLLGMIQSESSSERFTKSEREKIYSTAIKEYKSAFRRLKIESCRWTEMKRLIGSRHEEMALIHGHHPTHGFQCSVELKTEQRKGYPRFRDIGDFWVKGSDGNWDYFGRFYGVDVRPRRQRLNQNLLKDPEGTIMRQSTMDAIANSFN